MSDTQSNWLEFTVPGLGVRLRYPIATADGERIEMDDFHAHFRTMNSSQVYFEISRHSGISAHELYERETSAIRGANPDVRVSELVSVSFAGCDAQQFNVTFRDKERIFTLIEREGAVYRVIHDPVSPLNHEIIGTIEFA